MDRGTASRHRPGRELFAADPEAYARITGSCWTSISPATVEVRSRPVDDPLLHLLADRAAPGRRSRDALYVRLVDLDRALGLRTCPTPVDVVLDVRDAFCPWNAGRWRLSGDASGAICARTSDPADVALSATELGAAYLGGTSLGTLARAGRVEMTRGSLAVVDRAFRNEPLLVSGDVLTVRFASACSLPQLAIPTSQTRSIACGRQAGPDSDGLATGAPEQVARDHDGGTDLGAAASARQAGTAINVMRILGPHPPTG